MFNYLLIIFTFLSLIACGQADSNVQSDKPINTKPSLLTDQKMDTAYFWKIMDYAFSTARFDNKLKEQAILDQLIKLTPDQIQEFEIIFQQMNLKANTWNNMAAHTIIEGGSSDDTFFYFRCWLISLGKYHFDETLKNPDHLSEIDIPVNNMYGYGEVLFEELIPMSDNAYQIVTKMDPTGDKTFPRAFAQSKGLFFDSGGDTKGIEWDEQDLPKIAPKLYAKFNGK